MSNSQTPRLVLVIHIHDPTILSAARKLCQEAVFHLSGCYQVTEAFDSESCVNTFTVRRDDGGVR